MGKTIILVGLLLVTACAMGSRDPIHKSTGYVKEMLCKIPVPLPPWNGLVLRLWGHGRINDETFLKNFPISGESGDKILLAQGFRPTELENLARCLIKGFPHAHQHRRKVF